MREKGVQSLQSQADWTNHGLLRFFDSSGFGLAPRLVLERSVLTPLAEAPDDE
jgi:preprotein translocase subunit Sec61beta